MGRFLEAGMEGKGDANGTLHWNLRLGKVEWWLICSWSISEYNDGFSLLFR